MVRNRLNALEILKLLPRTNCRECGLPSCMAFANVVARGEGQPESCPYLDLSAAAQARDLVVETLEPGDAEGEILDDLTRRVRQVDFSEIADLVGARLRGEELAFRCLGKEFLIDPRGRLRSQCHANFWVLVPLLDSIARAAERGSANAPARRRGWLRFDELRQTMSRTDFFSTTCEEGLRRLADGDLDLFADILEVFGARRVDEGFDADLSVVIRPLPRVSLLICYWRAEDGFESKLGVYFESGAEEQLSVESIYILVTGLVEMLKRITARHAAGLPGDRATANRR